MRTLTQMPRIDVDVNLKLTMAQVQALEALAGYGADAFLESFYKQMGKYYLQPHEAGLRSLFAAIQSELPPIIERYKAAKKAFALANPVIRSREDHNALIARVEAAAVAAVQRAQVQQTQGGSDAK